MKWEDMRRSDNVEDRRGQSSGFPGGLGRSSGGLGGGGLGLGRLLQLLLFLPGKSKWLVLLVLGFMLLGGGGLFGGLVNQPSNNPTYDQVQTDQSTRSGSQEVETKDQGYAYMASILGSTEDFWVQEFQRHGGQYKMPKMVLYTHSTPTGGCGFGSSQAGPFYCPADETIYIDLNFMKDLQTRYKAPGDFAMAYVISHEVGHHVQKELGIMDQYTQAHARMGRSQANQLNVRLELQADYFAGAWAKYAQDHGFLELGDVDEALQAAYAVGDDTIQKEAYGTIVPDSFTHGTAQQRQAWFKHGLQHGNLENSDSFSQVLPNEL